MFTLLIYAGILSITSDIVLSKYVYREQIGASLAIRKVIATWDEAQQKCYDEGAVLASPTNDAMLRELLYFVGKGPTPYYIGIKAEHYPGPYKSIEGISLDDMPVLDMFPQLDPRQGDCLSMGNHSIYNVPCWTRLPYICYKNMTEPAPDHDHDDEEPVQPDNNCDSKTGYKLYLTGSCYKLHQELKTWNDANKTCVMEGASLAVIDDAKELEAMKEAKLFYQSFFTLIGVHNVNGHWRSVHGDSMDRLYNAWRYGLQPTTPHSLCSAIHQPSLKLDQYSCITNAAFFLCEKRPKVHY